MEGLLFFYSSIICILLTLYQFFSVFVFLKRQKICFGLNNELFSIHICKQHKNFQILSSHIILYVARDKGVKRTQQSRIFYTFSYKAQLRNPEINSERQKGAAGISQRRISALTIYRRNKTETATSLTLLAVTEW